MKICEIVESKKILDNIAQNKNLPTRTAYIIYKLLVELTPSIDFYTNRKLDLFHKYGKEEGADIIIPVENRDIFLKELEELNQVECTDEIQKIDISLDIDLGISPSDFFLLKSFINFIE